MPMVTTLTVYYEGPPACTECQKNGVPVCGHTGFNPEAWGGLVHAEVMAPGLDPNYVHTVRGIEISADRKAVALTIYTDRPQQLDMARHLSILGGPKALVRAVHVDSGAVLAEGAFDGFLQPGQPVWINGDPHVVTGVDHPHRDPVSGSSGREPDWQVATVQPVPRPEPVTQIVGGSP
jgi:hypothetical protein